MVRTSVGVLVAALGLAAAGPSFARQPIQVPQPPPPGVVEAAQPPASPGGAAQPPSAQPSSGQPPSMQPMGPPPPPDAPAPEGLPPPPPGYGYSPGGYSVVPETPYRVRQNPIRGYLGFSGLATFVAGQSGGPEYLSSGGGVSIWGGVRFAEHFAIELSYVGSFHNPDIACAPGIYFQYCYGNYLVLDLLSMAGKYHFLEDRDLDPFVQVGAVLGWIGREGFRGDASGGGFHAGGGFDYWINPWVTIGTRVLYWGVRMGDLAKRPGMDTFLSLVTAELAFGVHF